MDWVGSRKAFHHLTSCVLTPLPVPSYYSIAFIMEMSRPIYVIGKHETVIAGTALMRTVISEKHTSPMQGVITSDFSVVNMF